MGQPVSKAYISDVVSFLEGTGFNSVPRVERVSEVATLIGSFKTRGQFVNRIIYRHDLNEFWISSDPFRGTPETIEVGRGHPWYETLSTWLMQRTLEQ